MGQVTLSSDPFFEIKQALKSLHYDRGRRLPREKLSRIYKDSEYRYKIKKQSRIRRQELMRSDARFYELFNWIANLQERTIEAKLVKNRKQFAKLIGTTEQSLKHWKNFNRGCGGHFPSDKALRNLLRIEVILQAKIEVTKVKVNIKSKRFPSSRIRIPRLKGRRRLKANYSY